VEVPGIASHGDIVTLYVRATPKKHGFLTFVRNMSQDWRVASILAKFVLQTGGVCGKRFHVLFVFRLHSKRETHANQDHMYTPKEKVYMHALLVRGLHAHDAMPQVSVKFSTYSIVAHMLASIWVKNSALW
jgi:hypothetical protein